MARLYEGKLFEQNLPEVSDLLFGGGYDRPVPVEVADIMRSPYHLLPELAARARAAAIHRGVSHRDFLVGSAVYVTNQTDRRAAILYGANFTPFPGAPKRCAEMEVLEKAYRGGFDKVYAIGVSGPLQPDQQSRVVSPTLHPCSECRNLLRRHPLVYPDTLLITADETGEEHEVYSMPELFRLHGASYFDEREDLYADDIKLAEAIAMGWGDEQPRSALHRRLAALALGKIRNLYK